MSPAWSPIFFFNDTATTEIYTLSLHDALPIYAVVNDADGLMLVVEKFPGANTLEVTRGVEQALDDLRPGLGGMDPDTDRKSTRLNSSHANISYAVFCLKKKKRRGEYWTPRDLR